jgi:hypothetical protein
VSLDVLRFRTQDNSPADGSYRIKTMLKDSLNNEAVQYVDVQPISGW